MLSLSWAETFTICGAIITIITAAWKYGKSTKEMEVIINNSINSLSKEFDHKLTNQVPRETFIELKQDVNKISEKVDKIAETQARHDEHMGFQDKKLSEIQVTIQSLIRSYSQPDRIRPD